MRAALDGGISFNTGNPLFGSIRVPLQYNGTLAVKDLLNNPQALLQSAAARKLATELMGGFFGH